MVQMGLRGLPDISNETDALPLKPTVRHYFYLQTTM